MAIRGVPRVPSGVRERPRLVRRFDGPQAVVVAQGPAGYGKSVAMAQWAAATAADGIWVRIRDGNAGSAAFVQHLAAELAAAGLLDDAHPLLLATEALSGGADPWTLLRRGLQALHGPLTIAVDEIDRLTPECVNGLVDVVLDVPQLSVRATSRRRGPLNDPALALKLDVAVIGATDLALTPDEIADALSIDVTSPAVARIAALGGLPILTRLTSQSLDESSLSREGPTQGVIDSLIDAEIASRPWDPRFALFVRATSVADSLDRALAAELADIARSTLEPTDDVPDDVGALLARAEDEGLGLWTGTTRTTETFTYTPLIREGFERRLRFEQPRLVETLVRAVARWELAHGRPFAALRRAVELRDWELASRVIRTYWNELLRNHGQQLRRLFHGTPLSVLRRQPLITMLLALEYNRTGHHRLRALEYFALAGHAARTQRDRSAPADRVVLRAIESAALRVSGRFDGALVAALDGRRILLAMSPDDRDGLGRVEPTLHNQFGTSLFYAGRTEDALDSFARSTSVGASKGLKAGLQGMALSAGALAAAGDLRESIAMIEQSQALEWPEGWLTGYMGSFNQLAGAFAALERWDADAADRHIRSLDPHRETIEHWPLLAHVDVLVELLRGHPERARLALDAEMLMQRRRRSIAPPTLARLAHTRSLIELAAGRPAAAERALGKAASARRSTGLARIALARAQPDDALRHLANPAASAGDPASSRSRAEAMALRAGALALAGDAGRAAVSLGELLEFMANRQQGLALALVPAQALDALLEVARVSTIGDPHELLEGARAHAVIGSLAPAPSLTPREIALARVLPRAGGTAELAEMLSVSPNTVKSQLRSLYRKLGAGNRAEALIALSVMVLSEEPAGSRRRGDTRSSD
ncbi:LuxR family maltose regulon positive regulatory protein [Conyzicola nivalis]|uniref:LuxR family maltose regulon positive regulatory protein n=1 Tax=Conyzicola nivalis TaxID=1477021 RepID=A0ABV2QL62_9MICO